MTEQQRRKGIVSAVITVFVSLVLTITFGAAYVTHEIQKSNRRTDHEIVVSNQRWCTMYEDITRPRPTPPANPAAPPTSEFGKELQQYNKQVAAADAKFLAELLDLARTANCPFVR